MGILKMLEIRIECAKPKDLFSTLLENPKKQKNNNDNSDNNFFFIFTSRIFKTVPNMRRSILLLVYYLSMYRNMNQDMYQSLHNLFLFFL